MINNIYIIKDAKIAPTRKGDKYLDLLLFDGKTEIQAKKWDFEGEAPQKGVVLVVDGTMSEYKGTPQLTINGWRKAEPGEYSYNQFLPVTKNNVDEMFNRILNAAGTIKNENLYRLVEYILVNHKEVFKTCPAAASMHHAYLGGLLEHSLNVLNHAVYMAKLSPDNIDMDLIIAGPILHDIGKIETYMWDKGVIERSIKGRLIEHVVLGCLLISRSAAELNIFPLEIEKLLHIVVSHHGQKAWGSPVEPAIKEAMIIHRADELDAIMAKVDEAIERVEDPAKEWEYLKPDNVALYLK